MALAILFAAATLAWPADEEPLPYSLRIEVGEGTRRSPSTLRADIEAALRLKLAEERCVHEIRDAAAPAGGGEALLLRVLVDDYREETLWDIGIVQRTQPANGHDPEMDSSVVLDVTAQAELHVAPGRPPLRRKTFPVHIVRRPQTPGEDVAAAGRVVLVEKIVRETYNLLCKGSRRKLARDIDKERAAAPAESAPPVQRGPLTPASDDGK